MKKFIVPPAPMASWEVAAAERNKTSSASTPSSAKRSGAAVSSSSAIRVPASHTPLDADFLCRVYRSLAWFGVLIAVLTGSAWGSKVGLSVAAGVVLGAFLLKSQEMFVRRVLRPRTAAPYEGWDAKIPIWFLWPMKYVLVVGGLVVLLRADVVSEIFVGCGFIAAQMVLAAKVFGFMLKSRVRTVRDVYIDSNK